MRLGMLRATGTDSPNRKIFRAVLIVGALTLLAKLGSTAKELLVANSFGRSDALDAFLIAFVLPAFAVNLLIGSFASAVVPAFVEMKCSQGPAAAQKLFSNVMFACVLGLLALTLGLGSLAPWYLPYLASSFSPAKLQLTREILYMLLPFVLFNGVALCASAILNAGEKFALPALTPVVTPLVTMAFIVLGPRSWSTFSLAAGVVLGSFLEAALVLQALKAQGIRLTMKWYGFDPSVRSILRQYRPLVAGSFVMGAASVVDQSMAAMLPQGSVSALSYASRTISVVLWISAASLSTAVLPYFSQMVAQNDWAGCRNTLRRYTTLVAAIAVPCTLCLMAFSRPLVRLLFQRGAFTAADTALVSRVQICYAIQIPFYIGTILFVRFLSSAMRNHVLLWTSGICLVLDILLNLALMRIWGVAGIALATSLVYVTSFVLVSAYSGRLLARKCAPGLAAPMRGVAG
jgi:putative peptidoglycan lipid II flippase